MKGIILILVVGLAFAARAGILVWGVANDGMELYPEEVTPQGTLVYLIPTAAQSHVENAIADGSFDPDMPEVLGIIETRDDDVSVSAFDNASLTEGATYYVSSLVFEDNDVGFGRYAISGSIPAVAAESESALDASVAVFSEENGWDNASGTGTDGWVERDEDIFEVPEPSMAVLALAGVGFLMRRRRK